MKTDESFYVLTTKKGFKMPRPTMDVNGAEYQEILKQRELYRLYKSDYPDIKWVHDVMERLEKKQSYGDYTDIRMGSHRKKHNNY